jgi:O-methyltransferase involved in polyketide biosynthesis
MENKPDLSGVAFTSLLPLYGRALETQRPDAILRDEKALALVEQLDYDFSKLEGARPKLLGAPIRAKMIDDLLQKFLQKHSNAALINLGAGFDTRFERLDNGTLLWFDLDLPEVIAVRRQFFSESERVRFIKASVLEKNWVAEIDVQNRPLLVIAEGLLMYFTQAQVQSIFASLASTFHQCEAIFDIVGYGVAGKMRKAPWMNRLDSDELAAFDNLTINWAPRDAQEMESWGLGIRVMKVENLFDFPTDRFQEGAYRILMMLMRLFPRIKDRNGVRIVHVRINYD